MGLRNIKKISQGLSLLLEGTRGHLVTLDDSLEISKILHTGDQCVVEALKPRLCPPLRGMHVSVNAEQADVKLRDSVPDLQVLDDGLTVQIREEREAEEGTIIVSWDGTDEGEEYRENNG